MFASLFVGSASAAEVTTPQQQNGQHLGVDDDKEHPVKPVVIKEDKVKEQKLDQKLKKAGYTDDVLAEMQTDLKEHLISQGVEKYLGTEKKEFNLDEHGMLKEKAKENGDVTASSGTISDTSLTLYIDRAELASSSGKRRFTITNRWTWSKSVGINGDTYYNLTDKIGMAYSDKFNADPLTNGGYQCSHSGQEVATGVNKYFDSCGGRPSTIDYGGAGWNVDIHANYRDYGWSSMNIIAKTAYTGGKYYSSVNTKYAHDTTLNGSLGLTIGPLSLAFSSTGGWDEASDSLAFYY